MLDHMTIRVSDLEASRRFYRTLLQREPEGEEFLEWDEFGITAADGEHPATRHLHVAFAAESPGDVDAFWRRGVDAGYASDGEPGLRPYAADYYGAFLLDPDGNSVEAVHRPPRTESGAWVDHLWLGVADLEASCRFWEAVAPVLGLRVERKTRLAVVGREQRHLAVVADGRPPTESLHLAFPVADDAAVAEFHRVALAAGYRDNGAPGERPQYHPGYVGAFVLDPEGTNVEAVHHNR